MSEKISGEMFKEYMSRERLNTETLAKYLVCSERTIYRWIKNGIESGHFQNVKIIVNYNKRNR